MGWFERVWDGLGGFGGGQIVELSSKNNDFEILKGYQPTAVEGARDTGTRLRVCNCSQKHAQEPRATNRRREGFGRVREDLGVLKL